MWIIKGFGHAIRTTGSSQWFQGHPNDQNRFSEVSYDLRLSKVNLFLIHTWTLYLKDLNSCISLEWAHSCGMDITFADFMYNSWQIEKLWWWNKKVDLSASKICALWDPQGTPKLYIISATRENWAFVGSNTHTNISMQCIAMSHNFVTICITKWKYQV